MSNPIKWSIHKLGRLYLQKVTQSEASVQAFVRHNERAAEYAFVFRQVNAVAPQTVLDVGTGTTALPALLDICGCVVTAIDNVRDYWTAGMVNRHWYVIDDDIQETSQVGPFDMVTCISVLEHINDHGTTVRNMMRLLRPGGISYSLVRIQRESMSRIATGLLRRTRPARNFHTSVALTAALSWTVG